MTESSENIFVKTSPNGTVHTYVNGKLHSINDEPSKHRKIMGEYSWHKDGKLHREKDKPAVIRDYEYAVRLKNEHVTLDEKEWYLKGIRHRDGDKPAMVIKKTVIFLDYTKVEVEKRWYQRGKISRSNNKPAITITSRRFNNTTKFLIDEIKTLSFVHNNNLHRDDDKPAVIENSKNWDENKQLIRTDSMKKWYQNNKYHRDGDKPAIIMNAFAYKHDKKDLTYHAEYYYKNGYLHRDEDKPAMKDRRYYSDGKSYKADLFYKENQLHRDGDKPAYIHDFSGDKCIAYLKSNKLDRENNPAIIASYEDEIYFQYYKQGEIFKPDDNSYIACELQKYDSSLDINNLKGFPSIQLLSMLNALSTSKIYSMEIPVTYMNDIKNAKSGV